MNGLEALAEALYEDGCITPPRTDHAKHVVEALAARGFFIEEGYFARRDREREQVKQERTAAKAAALAAAIPYSGVIVDCQAIVWAPGRGIFSHRCNRRAKFAVRRGEDRIAVCRQHAEDKTSHRYRAHSKYGQPSADEVVEPEYQP